MRTILHLGAGLLIATVARAQPEISQPASAPASAPAAPASAPAAPVSAPAAPVRVAVYELQSRGVPARVAAVATSSLLAELRKLERVSAIGMDEIRDMLTHEENKQLLGCDEESCLAEIAGALGTDELVTGSVGQVGDKSVLNLRRIDLGEARVLATVDRHLTPADGEEFLAAVGPAVAELYAGYPLKPGTARGVPEEVALRLNPPPLPVWLFWSTAGAAALVAAASGGATAMAALSWGEANQMAADSVDGPAISNDDLMAKRDAGLGWDVTRISLYAGAGALLLGAGLVAIFTDWHGYGEEAP